MPVTAAAPATAATARSTRGEGRDHRRSPGLDGRAQVRRQRAPGRQGISMTQLHVLHLLEHHGELTMSRLAELLDVSLSNATGLIDRMEERGLVERDPGPERPPGRDGPADAGRRQMLDEIETVREQILRRVLDQLDRRAAHRRRHRDGRPRANAVDSHLHRDATPTHHAHQAPREGLTPMEALPAEADGEVSDRSRRIPRSA